MRRIHEHIHFSKFSQKLSMQICVLFCVNFIHILVKSTILLNKKQEKYLCLNQTLSEVAYNVVVFHSESYNKCIWVPKQKFLELPLMQSNPWSVWKPGEPEL